MSRLVGAALLPQDLHSMLHRLAINVGLVAGVLVALLVTMTTWGNRRLPRLVPTCWLLLTLLLVAWAVVSRALTISEVGVGLAVGLQKAVALVAAASFLVQTKVAERILATALQPGPS